MKRYRVQVNDKSLEVELLRKAPSSIEFAVNGSSYMVSIDPVLQPSALPVSGQPSSLATPAPRQSAERSKPGEVVAPMPGVIVSIAVKAGDTVEAGDTLLIIEAMKMENNIPAPAAGSIKKIHVKPAEEVENGQLLIELS